MPFSPLLGPRLGEGDAHGNRCGAYTAHHPQHLVACRPWLCGGQRWTAQGPPPIVRCAGFVAFEFENGASTPVLKSIFTWWNGATIGIRFTVARRGVFIGQ